MKRKRNKNIGGVDRISELPECIIHGIMSRLSSKEVARTCVLSKTWYHLKRNYPVLDFNIEKYTLRGNEKIDYLSKIRQAVYDSLNHFSTNKLALQTFSLRIVISGYCYSQNNVILGPNPSFDLDYWVRVALDNGVKDLILYLPKQTYFGGVLVPTSLYTLPESIFSSKTLTSLELSSCVLDMPMSMFSSLKKLALVECSLKGSISLKDTDCPALEELSVRRCCGKGFKSIYISSLLQLHSVVVSSCTDWNCITVNIISQSIKSLALKAEDWSDINIYGCDRLKSLYLKCAKITDVDLHSLLLNFPLLEELYLFGCGSLKMIKISSPQLKTLEICYDQYDYNSKLIEISAPNLENFICKSFSCGSPSNNYDIEAAIVIAIADCCRSLKTLVLYVRKLTDKMFHNLISRFPLLENIWIIGCNSLQNIKVPNLQLKMLYIVSCSGLKDVEVSSPNLREFYCSSRTLPKSFVADVVCASGVRCMRSSTSFCLLRLKEILKPLVHIRGECILNEVVSVGTVCFEI